MLGGIDAVAHDGRTFDVGANGLPGAAYHAILFFVCSFSSLIRKSRSSSLRACDQPMVFQTTGRLLSACIFSPTDQHLVSA
jgi:hypothetical protein